MVAFTGQKMGSVGVLWEPKQARGKSVLAPNPGEMNLKVVQELLLDVPEVLLEVLDLYRRC